MHYLQPLLFIGLILVSGCCHVGARQGTGKGVSLVATYRLGHDDAGFDTVQCYLSNVGDQTVYISDPIMCSWTIEPNEASGEGEYAGGIFWFHATSLPVHALLQIAPAPREVVERGLVPDVSLPISGRLFLGDEKVHVGSSRLVLSVHVNVYRDLLANAKSIEFNAKALGPDQSGKLRVHE